MSRKKSNWKNKKVQNFDRVIQFCNPQLSTPLCMLEGCSDLSHKVDIARTYNECVHVLVGAGDNATRQTTRGGKNVPGWNVKVKPFYDEYRHYFLRWVTNGRIKNVEYEEMCAKRKIFKHQLKRCREESDEERLGALAADLGGRDFPAFWQRVEESNGNVSECAEVVVSVNGAEDVCSLWADIFEKQFSLCNTPVEAERDELLRLFDSANPRSCQKFTDYDVRCAVAKLSVGKSIGSDGFLPQSILEVRIIPIVKKDLM